MMIFYKKKGQAAMEFLMTYGWALLVVLAAIGALAYFGVLSPQRFLPEQCTLAPGLACLDFKVSSGEINLLLSNSMGKNLNITGITAGNCNSTFSTSLDNGDQAEFLITGCDNGDAGVRFKENLVIAYTDKNTGFSKTITGSIAGKVQ